jgi:hypothetical protein
MMAYALQLAREKDGYKAMRSSNVSREDAHDYDESLGFARHGYRLPHQCPTRRLKRRRKALRFPHVPAAARFTLVVGPQISWRLHHDEHH